jgi:septation ring formation regulator EzrA
MTQMTVNIPKVLASLSPKEREGLIREGVYEAVQTRIRQIKAEITESEKQVSSFEEKYGISLEQFEKRLGNSESFQAHEDYNDWFFWSEVLNKNRRMLSALQENQDR